MIWQVRLLGKTRILGIDPGYAIVGFGVVEYDGYNFVPIHFGAITTQAGTDFTLRLKTIFDDMNTVLTTFKPEAMAIEKLFFNTNQKTGIDVAQARGVTLLAAVNAGVPIFEYTPLQVKQSVVGYGRAEKPQVMEMTRKILGLAEVPKPDDTADALAIAICHGHSGGRISVREGKL
ncbi:MAG: crossover junction endodeoxyribonuclease RuvC [Oscillospiraceae bacterium]|nr:crossover junction endodeoxyribonuclease RuvC [Oscillospiraceae bacterium]